jgi:hypothetical protein
MVEIEIMTTLAGGLTQMHWFGLDIHEVGVGVVRLHGDEVPGAADLAGQQFIVAGDMKAVVDLAFKVSGSDEEASAYIGWLQERTANLVRHWVFRPMVDALSAALLERQELTSREARDVIERAQEASATEELATWHAQIARTEADPTTRA